VEQLVIRLNIESLYLSDIARDLLSEVICGPVVYAFFAILVFEFLTAAKVRIYFVSKKPVDEFFVIE
jgi:hypothetical protein